MTRKPKKTQSIQQPDTLPKEYGDLINRLEHYSRFLQDPETKEYLSGGTRGGLYLVNDKGEPTEPRFDRLSAGTHQFHPSIGTVLNMEPWPLKQMFDGFFQKYKVPLDDIIGYSLTKADTGGIMYDTPPYDFTLYKAAPKKSA